MKKLSALTLVIAMATATATSAIAMSDEDTISMGRSMLTGAIYNTLSSNQYDLSNIDQLTLGEIATINSILHSGDMSEGQKKARVETILDRASDR